MQFPHCMKMQLHFSAHSSPSGPLRLSKITYPKAPCFLSVWSKITNLSPKESPYFGILGQKWQNWFCFCLFVCFFFKFPSKFMKKYIWGNFVTERPLFYAKSHLSPKDPSFGGVGRCSMYIDFGHGNSTHSVYVLFPCFGRYLSKQRSWGKWGGDVRGTNLSQLGYLSKTFRKSIIPWSSEKLLFRKDWVSWCPIYEI